MKKLNKKGFTLVELLAVITILGILMVITVGALFRHLVNSKQQAMETIASSSYDGMVMYMMDNNIMLNKNESISVTIDTLYNDQRIKRPTDPYKDDGMCTGKVTVINKTSTSTVGLEDYRYTVEVNCAAGHSYKQTYPKE